MIIDCVIKPGLSLLPKEMDTPNARAMLISIGLQESRFKYRFQQGGPARGFFQFERGGGVKGVMSHPKSGPIAKQACDTLRVPFNDAAVFDAIPFCDSLACTFARLLLWTLPGPLAGQGEFDKSWGQYVSAWRPGKPHRGTWNDFYAHAWGMV